MRGWVADAAVGFLMAVAALFAVCGISWCWLRWKIEKEKAERGG